MCKPVVGINTESDVKSVKSFADLLVQQKKVGAVTISERASRIKMNGLVNGGQRFFESSDLPQRCAAIAMRKGTSRINKQCVVER